ncbi:MAG: M50 family metallopeptidase [Candidatus Omnitrophica bacterium]|nr:M50 family metallopeptidase [Candidatus Omnitrophota bacterium]
MISFLIFIFIVGIVIIIHEFGHFIMAKKNKVKVEKFSIGFGPKIFSKKIKDTEYVLAAIPFGGYVKLAGDSLLEYTGKVDEYFSKSCLERAQIIVSGPLLNYLAAFICFWLVFYIGYPMMGTKIAEVIPGYGASQVGILPQDKIVAIDGKTVQYWEQLQQEVYTKKEGQTVELKVLRQGQIHTFNVIVKEKEMMDRWGNKKRVGIIGIIPAEEIKFVKHSLTSSFIRGTKMTIDLTIIIYGVVLRIISGKISLRESITGPLGMFYLTKEATRLGLAVLLHLVAVLNISLAVFNLLPLPVLDGFHLFLLGIEKARGKPLSYKIEMIVNQIGFAFIIMLAIVVFYNDLVRFGIWEKITQLLRR